MKTNLIAAYYQGFKRASSIELNTFYVCWLNREGFFKRIINLVLIKLSMRKTKIKIKGLILTPAKFKTANIEMEEFSLTFFRFFISFIGHSSIHCLFFF